MFLNRGKIDKLNGKAENASYLWAEVQKVVNPVILDDRKNIQNQGLAEKISKT